MVLEDGTPIEIYPNDNNSDNTIYLSIRDEEENLLIDKIVLNDGSEILVKPDENGVFSLKVNDIDFLIVGALNINILDNYLLYLEFTIFICNALLG